MNISLVTQSPQVDAYVLIAFESAENNPPASATEAAQAGWLDELRSLGEFSGKLYESVLLYRPAGIAAKRLVVIGGGKAASFSSVEARRLAGVLVRSLKSKGIQSIALELPDSLATDENVAALAEGALLGNWEPDKYKSDASKPSAKSVAAFHIVAGNAGKFDAALQHGIVTGNAQNFTRDLINEPANRLTPLVLSEHAKSLASAFGLEVEILDRAAMEEKGMGAILGVAQGSIHPPFLIRLSYSPERKTSEAHLALVGKGVTFDTGGISIKPSDGMDKMKYDMSGAAAVLGAMQAIAQLRPPVRVSAFIPTVENAVGQNAQRPGDIVKTLSGKTVEVLNTDAEGRLILADALTYAKEKGVTHIVDAATLTGAIGVALGHHNMGAFTNSAEFLQVFLACSRASGEKAWQLPMDDEYKDYLKSAVADLPNIGGRYGGSITAAWFLREFADPTPWIHLDIASTAWLDDAKPWLAKGPSGVTVRTFVRLALEWAA